VFNITPTAYVDSGIENINAQVEMLERRIRAGAKNQNVLMDALSSADSARGQAALVSLMEDSKQHKGATVAQRTFFPHYRIDHHDTPYGSACQEAWNWSEIWELPEP